MSRFLKLVIDERAIKEGLVRVSRVDENDEPIDLTLPIGEEEEEWEEEWEEEFDDDEVDEEEVKSLVEKVKQYVKL